LFGYLVGASTELRWTGEAREAPAVPWPAACPVTLAFAATWLVASEEAAVANPA
jgi:hypothetical protein